MTNSQDAIRKTIAEEQKVIYEDVKRRVTLDYRETPLTNSYWKFNGKEVEGSNLGLGIIANKFLAR